MEQLQHDPLTKSLIKEALFSFLYDPVKRQFKTRIDTLIARNSLLGGFSHNHFVYKAKLYNGETTVPPLKKNRLVPALRDQMEEYLADQKQLNDHEIPYVVSFINQVLNSSNDFHDWLRLFPDSVHLPITQLQATCPCRTIHLPQDKVDQLRAKNQDSINLMKQRLVTNLLI